MTNRVPIIGGNWKMNTTLPEAAELARGLVQRLGAATGVDIVLCPPFTNLQAVQSVIAATSLKLGAQDVFWERSGAFTGEVSAPMLTSVGAEYVITGHSERRHILGESSELVNRKTRAALSEGLTVILAIGEKRDERHAGETENVCSRQLTESLAGLSSADMASVVIAYEPVWAIGTGETATPDQAQSAHGFIRSWLAGRFDHEVSASTRIQYGGSVTAANACELLSQPDIDGALVGGASLKPDDFAAIVRAAGQL